MRFFLRPAEHHAAAIGPRSRGGHIGIVAIFGTQSLPVSFIGWRLVCASPSLSDITKSLPHPLTVSCEALLLF
jgi:hypothetical protein